MESLRTTVSKGLVAMVLLLCSMEVKCLEGTHNHPGGPYLLNQQDQRLPPSGEESLKLPTPNLTASEVSGK